MTGSVLKGSVYSTADFWSNTVAVTAGKTYKFEVDYINQKSSVRNMTLTIDGEVIDFISVDYESGHLIVNYVAPTTKTIGLALTHYNSNSTSGADFWVDNLKFTDAGSVVLSVSRAGGRRNRPFTPVPARFPPATIPIQRRLIPIGC
jgi:hypothetical protein